MQDGVLQDHFFTGGSDSSVRLWKVEGPAGELVSWGYVYPASTADSVEPVQVQKIDLKGQLPLDIAVAYLPGSHGQSWTTG
jgi:hypothetical protein